MLVCPRLDRLAAAGGGRADRAPPPPPPPSRGFRLVHPLRAGWRAAGGVAACGRDRRGRQKAARRRGRGRDIAPARQIRRSGRALPPRPRGHQSPRGLFRLRARLESLRAQAMAPDVVSSRALILACAAHELAPASHVEIALTRYAPRSVAPYLPPPNEARIDRKSTRLNSS